ncbi:MAG: response regulator transcription factor [Sphingomonadales bacterium]|nr:response regulator transcription factor [Sphingomonadales bacterium]
MNLLVIGQDSTGTNTLAQRLAGAGFRPLVVESAQEALAGQAASSPVAILVDQGVNAPLAPGLIGLLRREGLHQPLVVLSARDDWRERIASFESGADDVVIKPVHSEEVAVRLRSALRRTMGASSDHLELGALTIDLKGQCAWLSGRCLDLTRNEYRLLYLFAGSAEGIVTREAIGQAVWPDRPDLAANTIEVLVARLRAKLGADHVQTLRGMGYRLVLPDEAAGQIPLRPCCR